MVTGIDLDIAWFRLCVLNTPQTSGHRSNMLQGNENPRAAGTAPGHITRVATDLHMYHGGILIIPHPVLFATDVNRTQQCAEHQETGSPC